MLFRCVFLSLSFIMREKLITGSASTCEARSSSRCSTSSCRSTGRTCTNPQKVGFPAFSYTRWTSINSPLCAAKNVNVEYSRGRVVAAARAILREAVRAEGGRIWTVPVRLPRFPSLLSSPSRPP